MGAETIIKTAADDIAKKGGLNAESLGKGGIAAALLAIIIFFGNQMVEQQEKATAEMANGNQTMTQLVETSKAQSQNMSRAVDAMKEATTTMKAAMTMMNNGK